MNGFNEKELDEGAFGAKAGSIVSAFDVFRMSPPPTPLPYLGTPRRSREKDITIEERPLTRRSQGEARVRQAHVRRRQVDHRHVPRVGVPSVERAGAVVARGRAPHVRGREGRGPGHADQPGRGGAHAVRGPARQRAGRVGGPHPRGDAAEEGGHGVEPVGGSEGDA